MSNKKLIIIALALITAPAPLVASTSLPLNTTSCLAQEEQPANSSNAFQSAPVDELERDDLVLSPDSSLRFLAALTGAYCIYYLTKLMRGARTVEQHGNRFVIRSPYLWE